MDITPLTEPADEISLTLGRMADKETDKEVKLILSKKF